MKKFFSLFITVMILIQIAHAQQTENSGFDKSKLFFGGTLGGSFGTYTIVNVSPQVGYRLSPMFATGVGLNYNYYGYDDGYMTSKQTYLGMNIFGRVYPIPQLFLQAQPELNYMWASQTINGGGQYNPAVKINQFVSTLLLGGGAAIPVGSNGAIMISVMYDVLQNYYSPYYHQAVYGFGYNFGF
jgi:hypothetical protein